MPQTKVTVLTNRQEVALLISPVEEDHQTLERLFQDHGWKLIAVRSLGSATILLRDNVASVVITERDLPSGDWTDVLELARGLPIPPLIIVISRLADDYLWAEAVNLGAYDVLAKPMDQTEVVRVLTAAWTHKNRPQRH